MPELPEVETVVRGLRRVLPGRRIDAVWWSGKPLHLRRPVDVRGLRALAVGHEVTGVRRLGKFIVLDMDLPGAGVVMHLGMTGRLGVEPASRARAPHTHVAFSLSDGGELRLVDARRFGWVEPARSVAASAALARLGPDPLTGLDADRLAAALAGVRAPMKSFLMDQRRIAGLGNIYVSEALYRARIHPRTPAGRARKRAAALLDGIRAALDAAIVNRGTTLRDYVDAEGRRGDNGSALQVYGRAGLPCHRCGTAIRRQVDAGRATFYCPNCQRRTGVK
jgi:formamidopyrimidine-DNA glycosylase